MKAGRDDEVRDVKWAYRVAFAHQFVDFIVAMDSGSGRKGDSLFLCGSSRHCGSDWKIE